MRLKRILAVDQIDIAGLVRDVAININHNQIRKTINASNERLAKSDAIIANQNNRLMERRKYNK